MNFGTPTAQQIQLEQANFIAKVYTWMSAALIITGLTAMWVASSPTLIGLVVGNRLVFFGLIIGELILVSYLAAAVHRMSADMAMLGFLFYALLNGFTLSVLFVAYTQASIASTFFITAGTFAAIECVVEYLLARMAHRIRPALERYGKRFNRVCGGAFAAMGVALPMTR